MSVTLEQRDACRAKQIARMGADFTIPERVADAIRQRVETGFVIVGEEYSGMTLSFSVNTIPGARVRRMDLEGDLMRTYGNAPYNYYTDFTSYRLTFGAQ